MMNNGIGVNPAVVHQVADQCGRIRDNLDQQVSLFSQQLSSLESGLQGQAAEAFKAQFAKWRSLVQQMSETLATTGNTLHEIANTSEQQIRILQQFGNNS